MARQMKDSGVEWIGQIPENWKLPKVKNLFQIGRGRVISQLELEDEGYPVYSSQTKNNGCLGYISTYDFDRSQLTWTTDGANAGTVFLREGKHNCTNVCGTLLPNDDENNLRYLKYSLEFIAIYHKRADTNGYKIMNNEMAEIKITLPPKEEQDKIADFLDEKVGEIDNVIETTKATIEDYKKYKQSLITEAVTKGLNPDVEMKDSGIEWIGKIPEHWEIVPLKHKCILNAETLTEQTDQEYEFNYVEIGSVSLSDGIKEYERTVFKNAPSRARRVAKKDDIIISTVRTYLKAIAVVPEKDDVIVSTGFAVLTPNKIVPSFLGYFLKTDYFTNTVTAHSTGVSYPAINSSELVSFKILVPTEAEQEEIANYLDEKCTEIDNLISAKEQLIADMEGYKKSLIYEYVTGKKEVSDNE